VLLLRERHAHLQGPIRNGPPSISVAPLPFWPAPRFCRGVLRLRHFVLRVPIVFPNAPHRYPAMLRPRGFALISGALRRMTQVPRTCSQRTDQPPTPPSSERKTRPAGRKRGPSRQLTTNSLCWHRRMYSHASIESSTRSCFSVLRAILTAKQAVPSGGGPSECLE